MFEQNPLDHLVAIQKIAIFFRVSLWNQQKNMDQTQWINATVWVEIG